VVPAATEATVVSASVPLVDKETLNFTQDLVDYDKMMEAARRLKDEKAERLIAQCKDMWLKRHRGINPKLQEELDRDMLRTQVDREALRVRLRELDKAACAVEKEAKITLGSLVRQKDQAAARVGNEERENVRKLEKLRMRIDTRWTEPDFGQGLTEAQAKDFPKKAKEIIDHYRIALERLKLRCPDLPEHLEIQWEDFLDDFPITWLQTHRRRFGNVAGHAFLKSVNALFQAGMQGYVLKCVRCSSIVL
jgi:hypothetical protein